MSVNILGVVGSLRTQSRNAQLLDAIERLSPQLTFQRASIDMPLYNSDIEMPAAAKVFQEAIAAADGVLIVAPEYNYGIPGPLKNALDWASRPAYASVFRDKKVSMASLSPGHSGGARMQNHLKAVMLGMAAHVFAYPEVAVPYINASMDPEGVITNEKLEAQLRSFGEAFAAFVGG